MIVITVAYPWSVAGNARYRFMVDDTRIYMVGFSNGGMLTYRFAAERTHLLAAAAPIGRNDIILYTIEDWGHKWPGKFFSDRLGKSDPLQGFNAGDLIWDFLKNIPAFKEIIHELLELCVKK